MVSVGPVAGGGGGEGVLHGKKFNVAIFLDTIKMMNVKLCMVALLLIEPCLFIPLLVTLIVYQDYSSVEQL